MGEVLSRITNDVDTLGQSLNQSITTLITSITTMIGVLIMMLSISPVMTLIALLILPVSVLLVSLVVKFSQKYFRAQQKYLGDVNGQVEEVYAGHNVIQAFTGRTPPWRSSAKPTTSSTNPPGKASSSPA